VPGVHTPRFYPARHAGGPRGIGRYIRELARGLDELRPEERDGLEIIGLTSLRSTGACETTRDIGSYRGGPRSVAPTEADFYLYGRDRRGSALAKRSVSVTDRSPRSPSV
jgi:hypothetical protein